MRLVDFVSIKLTIFLIAGILIGYHLQCNISLIGFLLLAFLCCLAVTYKMGKRNHVLFGCFAMGTSLFLGVFVTIVQLPSNPTHYRRHLEEEPTKMSMKITEVLNPNDYSYRYFAEVTSVSNKRTSGSLILYIKKDSLLESLSVDDELLVHATIESPRSPLNPHQFSFKDYLNKRGVFGQLNLAPKQWIKITAPSQTLFGIAANFRKILVNKLKRQGFGKEELGVIQALLLGQRKDISEATYDDYKNAGAVHILAVSGLHVGILLLLLEFFFQPLERLRKGKNLKVLLIIALLWSFAFIAGLSPSIVRAVTMFSFLAYALHLNRATNTFNILAWSMFFILLFQPLFLFHVGFQMSYAAVFAILWIYPKLQQFWYPKNVLVRNAWQLLSVSIAAQVGVLPLSIFYFHQFPALFFISNLLVVPFLGIILGTGIVVVFLTYFEALPPFLMETYNSLIGAMNGIIHWVAQQEAFLFQNIPFDGVQLVLGYITLIVSVMAVSKKTFRWAAMTLSFIALFVGYLVFQEFQLSKKERLLLLHQNRNTVLLYQKGSELTVFSNHFEKSASAINDYVIGERIKRVDHDSLFNSYHIGGQKLLIIDNNGISPSSKSIDVVLMTQSPKIHLERLLDSLQPKILIADGSNYKSYVNRWKNTCNKRKLPFHYTGEKGAYEFSIKD